MAVTTNVSGDTKPVLPDNIKFENSFSTNMDWLAEVDTSNITSTYGMFKSNSNITSIPLIDTSNSTNFGQMFWYCSSLVTIPKLDTSKSTNFNQMCYGCTALENFPEIDMSSATTRQNIQQIFSTNIESFTNNSLNNILASLLTITFNLSSSYKKLSTIGLSQTMAEACTNLSNWSALQDKGWTTGY